VTVVARHALRESLRRRVFTVVAILTSVFLGLYAVGAEWTFDEVVSGEEFVRGVDETVTTGATLLGLAMFATLFLGTVLAVFLTLGAVRADAERGLLGPVLVRPVSRRAVLAGRYLAAAGVCVAYVLTVFAATVVITRVTGGWWPDRLLAPAAGLALAVALLAALSLAGSVVLSAAANGIAIFMLFGAGLVAGLLGQIGEALGSATLDHASEIASWVLPFEALYRQGLSALTADTTGLTRFAVSLGPFGGAQDVGFALWPYSVAYLAVVAVVAVRAFSRRDL
jgi:ABC-2 type transport system permease protein